MIFLRYAIQVTYYSINTTADFLNISSNKFDVYVLKANLDFTTVTNFVPQYISGQFNGAGYKISNVIISTPVRETVDGVTRQYFGLFLTNTSLFVQNLVLSNVVASQTSFGPTYDEVIYASPLLASGVLSVSNTTIDSCKITIVGNENRRVVGGLVGKSANLTVRATVVSNFIAELRIGGDGRQVGFLIGGLAGQVGIANVQVADSSVQSNSDSEFQITQVGGCFGKTTDAVVVKQSICNVISDAPFSSNTIVAGVAAQATAQLNISKVKTSLTAAALVSTVFGVVGQAASASISDVQTAFNTVTANGSPVAVLPATQSTTVSCVGCFANVQSDQYTKINGQQSGFTTEGKPIIEAQPPTTFTTTATCTSAGAACGDNAKCTTQLIGGLSSLTCTCITGAFVTTAGACAVSACVADGKVCGGQPELCEPTNNTCRPVDGWPVQTTAPVGMIVGIVIGGVVVIVGAIILVFYLLKRRKAKMLSNLGGQGKPMSMTDVSMESKKTNHSMKPLKKGNRKALPKEKIEMQPTYTEPAVDGSGSHKDVADSVKSPKKIGKSLVVKQGNKTEQQELKEIAKQGADLKLSKTKKPKKEKSLKMKKTESVKTSVNDSKKE